MIRTLFLSLMLSVSPIPLASAGEIDLARGLVAVEVPDDCIVRRGCDYATIRTVQNGVEYWITISTGVEGVDLEGNFAQRAEAELRETLFYDVGEGEAPAAESGCMGGNIAYELVPDPAEEEPCQLGSAKIRTADGVVVWAEFFFPYGKSADGAAFAACKGVVLDVLRTAKDGYRKQDLSAHTETVSLWAKGDTRPAMELELDLPAGFYRKEEESVDLYKPLPESGRGACMSFLSWCAASSAQDLFAGMTLAGTESGSIAGTPVEWQMANSEHEVFAHGLYKPKAAEGGMEQHVLVSAPSKAELDSLLDILKNGRVAPGGSSLPPLLRAAGAGDAAAVEELLAKGADVSTRDELGVTPLHGAAACGDARTARLLLEHGAAVDAADCNGASPLCEAACCGHLEVAKLLVERGANLHARDCNGWVPLHEAVSENRTALAAFLLDCGTDINCRDYDGLTPLHVAVMTGAEATRLLLERGADASLASADEYVADEHEPRKGLTPLQLAERLLAWKEGDAQIHYVCSVSEEDKAELRVIVELLKKAQGTAK